MWVPNKQHSRGRQFQDTHQNVLSFDVTMNHALLVEILQSCCNLGQTQKKQHVREVESTHTKKIHVGLQVGEKNKKQQQQRKKKKIKKKGQTNQPSINRPSNQPTNHSLTHSLTHSPTHQPDKPTDQRTNQRTNQPKNERTNQRTNQPNNQPNNRSTSKPTNRQTKYKQTNKKTTLNGVIPQELLIAAYVEKVFLVKLRVDPISSSQKPTKLETLDSPTLKSWCTAAAKRSCGSAPCE